MTYFQQRTTMLYQNNNRYSDNTLIFHTPKYYHISLLLSISTYIIVVFDKLMCFVFKLGDTFPISIKYKQIISKPIQPFVQFNQDQKLLDVLQDFVLRYNNVIRYGGHVKVNTSNNQSASVLEQYLEAANTHEKVSFSSFFLICLFNKIHKLVKLVSDPLCIIDQIK